MTSTMNERSTGVDVAQSSFEGWAIVEMMGHRKEIGFVTTQAFGQAVMFRVDTPEFPGGEFILDRPEYVQTNGSTSRMLPAGTKVKRESIPARSCLIAPGSLYAINPCSEAAARVAIERGTHRPLALVELPPGMALPGASAAVEDDEYGDDDDYEDADFTQ